VFEGEVFEVLEVALYYAFEVVGEVVVVGFGVDHLGIIGTTLAFLVVGKPFAEGADGFAAFLTN
jgi:hypothetical protein